MLHSTALHGALVLSIRGGWSVGGTLCGCDKACSVLMPEVTCAGVLVADVIVHPVDRWPERGRLLPVDGIALHSGGPAHTTGLSLAKLGVSTAVVGRVGADPFGAFLLDALTREGVEAHVKQDEEAQTSMTVVVGAAAVSALSFTTSAPMGVWCPVTSRTPFSRAHASCIWAATS